MRAMPSTEAQRTLVKSPPELWAELCDPSSLARHLGEFGEIRIVRVEPEQSVEWEAPDATGAIQLKPSGWGTRVTLTVVRELPEPAPEPEAVLEPEPEPEAVLEPEPEASSAPDQATVEGPEPQPTTRRSRLFARLFRRRWARAIEPEQPPAVEASRAQPSTVDEPELAQPEPEPKAQEPPPNLAAELAAELARVEEAMAEQDAALLSAVLDRLGAAHHRPFSRG